MSAAPRIVAPEAVGYAGERVPDAIHAIDTEAGPVIAYAFGAGPPVLCVSGGPGMSCDYVRDGHYRLADEGYRVIAYDQSGTGASARAPLGALSLRHYVDEIETVRAALGLERFCLLGQSWGVWLAIEYCLAHPGRAGVVILANGCADMPLHLGEMARLQEGLGAETAAMMRVRQLMGETAAPDYLEALAELDRRHICRLPQWPAAIDRSVGTANWPLYRHLWGANDYVCTGPLRTWRRLADLPAIRQPTLVIHGEHDEFTPKDAQAIAERLPAGELRILAESSHTPFFEQPDAYFGALTDFLRRHPLA